MKENASTPGGGSGFPRTQWTVIIDAASNDSPHATEALETLCAAYRQPIVNWFKRKDFYQDPEDLAQSFLVYLLEQNLLKKVTPRSVSFRAFLAETMRNFLHDNWDKNQAQKRGGSIEKVPLNDNDVDLEAESRMDSQLDLDFAVEIHRKVMNRLSAQEGMKSYIFQKDSNEGWAEIAARLGRKPEAVRKEVSRLRKSHFEEFRDEVAQIVTPAAKVEETRYLYELLFQNPPTD